MSSTSPVPIIVPGSDGYPPGSIGWLRARGVCCDCAFQPATRLMVDPLCSPPLPYCERCIRAINEARELADDPGLLEACPYCGGDGRYDDVQECSMCLGEGVVGQ